MLTGLVKLFLRTLPDSVLPGDMYKEFMRAAKLTDARVQLLTVHELVNRLPDAHYATLRYLMLHLDRVAQHAGANRMCVSNLSIVFGPTLMHGGLAAGGGNADPNSPNSRLDSVNEIQHQCKIAEIILKTCRIIFEEQ